MSGPFTLAPAPWRPLFLEHISKLDDPYMAVSTVGRDSHTGKPVPRVRYCGFRGLFSELKLHPSADEQLHQEGQQNPSIFESDMLSFTVDVRTEKIDHLTEFDNAIEVAFWVKEAASQWRMRGKAFVIGDEASQQNERDARKEIQKGLRRRPQQNNANEKDWSWEKEVTTYFANHSPVMRGSFKNPSPGHPTSEAPTDPNLKLGQRVTDLHDPIARKNFRVVVIRVEEVDRLDLTNYEKAERWKWSVIADNNNDKDPAAGHWEQMELWP